jgi:hypothetical protein
MISKQDLKNYKIKNYKKSIYYPNIEEKEKFKTIICTKSIWSHTDR